MSLMSQFSGDSEAWDPFPLPFPFSVLFVPEPFWREQSHGQ